MTARLAIVRILARAALVTSQSSANVVSESVVAFLQKVPPFQFLPVPRLRKLSRGMSLEYFPETLSF